MGRPANLGGMPLAGSALEPLTMPASATRPPHVAHGLPLVPMLASMAAGAFVLARRRGADLAGAALAAAVSSVETAVCHRRHLERRHRERDTVVPVALATLVDLPLAGAPQNTLADAASWMEPPRHLARRRRARLSESPFPGWQATVDGRESPILRANVVQRAVAGTHEVRFTSDPRAARRGLAVSVAAVVALLPAPVLLRPRRGPVG